MRPTFPGLLARPREDGGRLRRPPMLSPLGSLAVRIGIVLALLGVALAGHWFDREGYRDANDPKNEISFIDAVYFTAVTVTTTGFGDIVPVTPRARMFDAMVVTPIRLFVWLLFLGTAYQFLVQHMWEKWRMKSISARLTQHYIVAGYGTTGTAAVEELVANGIDPQRIVVIDASPSRVEAALAVGVMGLEGDATRNETQSLARIETAESFIACGGRDDTSALLVLTARQLNPNARISAIIKSADNEELVKKAGADTVINPVTLGGHLLARAASGSHIVDYISDLVTAAGRVQLIERAVRDDEIGRPLSSCGQGLAVRIIRGSEVIGFWEPAAGSIAAGDIILEIVPLAG
ncbi:potassium channel family protein [Sphingosinicella soli]|uniref:Voltage-gated potassium channel n=1 Tax=Sphingosinicella soli TaxID=333708 RepID=A0A7W7F633_9SPHN|nr:potassium channel family protein [Sphingosinicella soli]MBB4632120.1 voltage-gated potassium channel [Sphingosinicella soli]